VTAYYNENEAYAAQWLRNLIVAGHIAPGEVDDRDIRQVQPADLRGYTQVHLFAGIGVWSYALRLAGWPDDRRVWTGSCPCQPFSAAGRRLGTADERHLWPEMFRLIRECRPVTVFGEQVGGALAWLDLVCADLESEGYTVGAVDTCAAGWGAPHIRQRLWWVAESTRERSDPLPDDSGSGGTGREPARERIESCSIGEGTGGVADASVPGGQQIRGCPPSDEAPTGRQQKCHHVSASDGTDGGVDDALPQRRDTTDDEVRAGRFTLDIPGDAGGVAHSLGSGQRGRDQRGPGESGREVAQQTDGPGPTDELSDRGEDVDAPWSSCDWLPCRDGKWRPVEPGTFPLAHGVANRVGRVRAYGNCIVAPQAAAFVRAYMETRSMTDSDLLNLERAREVVRKAGEE